MSKDVKTKQRLGQVSSKSKRIYWGAATVTLIAAAVYGYVRYTSSVKVDIPVAKVRRGDFIVSIKARGEVRSVRSAFITAPQVPSPRIVRLAQSGKAIKKGEVVVEFDAAQLQQDYLEKVTNGRTADSEIAQTKAEHSITNESDALNLMDSRFNVQRAELEASKAEVISAIEGAKDKIDVEVAGGNLRQAKTTVTSHKVMQSADLERLQEKKGKTLRDEKRWKGYLGAMVLRAPQDGIVNILPNWRSEGSFGSTPPPFKEGDNAWTGAEIAEIPDLSSMRIEMKLDETDRGRIKLNQETKVRVDAIPDKTFNANIDYVSPIAQILWKGFGLTQKVFPTNATLKNLDARLRPGMSASAEIVLEDDPNVLLIPIQASFSDHGRPAVYVQHGDKFQVRHIEVGRRNDTDLVVLKGLRTGEAVALENPIESAKKAKKL
jgi:multidrug efflux pump subunit AcrA (membrane-fusion protein)